LAESIPFFQKTASRAQKMANLTFHSKGLCKVDIDMSKHAQIVLGPAGSGKVKVHVLFVMFFLLILVFCSLPIVVRFRTIAMTSRGSFTLPILILLPMIWRMRFVLRVIIECIFES